MIREPGESEEKDVVVLHHVLRVVQVRGREEQGQNARNGLLHCESQLPQEAEANQRGQHADKNVGAIADDDVAHTGVIAVVFGEDGKALGEGSGHVGRQHEQRLPDAIPALKRASAAVDAKFWILLGEDWRLRGPQGVSGLEAVLCVGGAELSRLHDKCDESGGQSQEE